MELEIGKILDSREENKWSSKLVFGLLHDVDYKPLLVYLKTMDGKTQIKRASPVSIFLNLTKNFQLNK